MKILGKKKKEEKAEAKTEKKEKKLLDIEVTVCRAPGGKQKIGLNGKRTIMDALSAAGLVKKDTEIVSVNGSEVDDDELHKYELEDGDRVTLVKNVEGGLR